jgi:hypothetical protein
VAYRIPSHRQEGLAYRARATAQAPRAELGLARDKSRLHAELRLYEQEQDLEMAEEVELLMDENEGDFIQFQ